MDAVQVVSSDVEALESFCLIGGIPVIIVSSRYVSSHRT